ncbi:hypothetical protein QJS04_geneDACA001717 [Acorus gramineus]|uniref:ZCF37 n=1 Tax=Acorus gramineus TaxID=55184 RepID=A0AAV9BF64_ACOGR|nr:hypothetical protein QJS04_geneDACA001717 [Acorus gramineus]
MIHSIMFCGGASLTHMDEDDLWGPSTPRGGGGSRRKQINKNPYSARGLDKFEKVLAELEARREKIVSQTGSQGPVPEIRFVYSNSQEWVPIIVRQPPPPPPQPNKKLQEELLMKAANPIPTSLPNQKNEESMVAVPVTLDDNNNKKKKIMKKSLSMSERGGIVENMLRWRFSYYWPVVMILILLCLVMSGRTFAIFCTSIWWYMVPSIRGGGSYSKRRSISMGKKEYGRRLSEKKLGGDVKKVAAMASVDGLASPRNHPTGKKG